ncbi:PD-(D/E)XK nuclease family protein [Winogradskyella ursingii]|uniref:PD-(D/E)XK nuclease family protein n=1 Tax=Winogradskyella ursingii TaxID=2686079 RepID=UPI0015CDD064|nr:PD-(D/E)XK nuclease family protein [Winogradskyella ursingii]
MDSFIKTVLKDLITKDLKFENTHFILPSKRAGVFLKRELSALLNAPIFSPKISSIEEFIEELSGIKSVPNTELLFRFYKSYSKITKPSEQEPFETFVQWAQIILQDFNEIDRYLIEQEKIFDYLNAIKELDHWSVNKQPTDLIKNHLKFWNRLKDYYYAFTEDLLNSKQGYQGLIYREAVENIESFIDSKPQKRHVFLGFNALNTSESIIIQALLHSDLADIYWDIDEVFFNDNVHDAGMFTRQHKKKWTYFNKHTFNWIENNYRDYKNIKVTGIPKSVGQAKYVGQLLKEISKTNQKLSSVAVVLGEENLLLPLLNSIPKEVKALNVTMGLPLRLIPLSTLFKNLFQIHKNNADKFYYKDVIGIISHPSIYPLYHTTSGNVATSIVDHIQKNNLVYLALEDLLSVNKSKNEITQLLFKNWENNTTLALDNCSQLIFKMKNYHEDHKSLNRLELEYLYRFNTVFNQLQELNLNYKQLGSISILHRIYQELLSTETLDFKGDPLEGLQIMGMLESRVLDFETVIITSVNEGILPSGKTNNSFIPFDVKIENNLPTFKEKDAVYTYHFYRLLQRAKNVVIIYNTEIDVLLGGEKSRFVTQLEVENIHEIDHKILAPEVPMIAKQVRQISKTSLVIGKLKQVASNGFSPSSLTNYIRNPIDFYYDKVLDIKEFEDVEENIAANTLGSVIHNTLEDFYKTCIGDFLNLEILESFKTLINKTVTKHFKKLYNKGDFSSGKNLIIFEIAKRYVSNFINSEIESVMKGNKIKILAIEANETIELKIKGLDFPTKLTGKVDRIDSFNGVTRIIDYKSGKVEQNKVEIVNWEDLTTDYDKYSKSFQVLCYAYIMNKKNLINLPVEAGIISFKNLREGFLKFGKKDTARTRTKEQLISQETLNEFENQLHQLILEIFDTNINFTEKEIKKWK